MVQASEKADLASFAQRLVGPFDGLVRVDDARLLTQEIEALGPWYLTQPALGSGFERVDGLRAREHLDKLLDEILLEERGVWSTMVYVQSRENPELIKVFHPRRAGCGCGSGGGIVPWWILSRFEPEVVPAWENPSCAIDSPKGGGWLDKLLSLTS